MSFKEQLKQQLKEIGYDKLGGLRQLSIKAGITHSSIYDWFNHDQAPRLSSVLKVLKVINRKRWVMGKPSITIKDLL